MTHARPYIAVAPMMDWTDRHCRYFLRLISPHVRLFTEMVTTGALIHGDRERFLRFDESEHPVALQLGGSDPDDLAVCAKMGEGHGYDEINLNCGCPSDRVQSGRFGACLMKEPDHVASCVESMAKAVNIPVTVKCRIGIDNHDDFAFLDAFVGKIADKGCKTFIIHARKAWLKGLSPKENRTVPPISYDRVAAVKDKYPQLEIIVNGEITSRDQVEEHLKTFDGVMIGREAYQNPYFLADIEQQIYGYTPPSREEVARLMIRYMEDQAKLYETPVKSMTRHMVGLYHGQPGAKAWRQALSILPHQNGATPQIIHKALNSINKNQKIAA